MTTVEVKKHKSREERFMEVAPNRVNRVIKSIESLQKCSSRNYQYTIPQVNKMFKAIRESLRTCEVSYRNQGKNGSSSFRF